MSHPKGIPDILGIRRVRVADLVAAGVEEVGVFVAIEVKTDRGTVSDQQKKVITVMRDYRAVAFVARSIDDAIDNLGLRNRFLL